MVRERCPVERQRFRRYLNLFASAFHTEFVEQVVSGITSSFLWVSESGRLTDPYTDARWPWFVRPWRPSGRPTSSTRRLRAACTQLSTGGIEDALLRLENRPCSSSSDDGTPLRYPQVLPGTRTNELPGIKGYQYTLKHVGVAVIVWIHRVSKEKNGPESKKYQIWKTFYLS